MALAGQPAVHHGGHIALPGGDVFACGPPDIARVGDPTRGCSPVQAGVGEIVVGRHVARMALGARKTAWRSTRATLAAAKAVAPQLRASGARRVDLLQQVGLEVGQVAGAARRQAAPKRPGRTQQALAWRWRDADRRAAQRAACGWRGNAVGARPPPPQASAPPTVMASTNSARRRVAGRRGRVLGWDRCDMGVNLKPSRSDTVSDCVDPLRPVNTLRNRSDN